ncbi:putative expressed protein [Lyophyllum shimeji]|uniref:Expressed protein n=1 Tax=Lyophyllum shimeji TaxID=47721 RepID=A0A9P3PMZ9_LYOSH|nr:putative expressed protein [Lyophyllum shimeji]
MTYCVQPLLSSQRRAFFLLSEPMRILFIGLFDTSLGALLLGVFFNTYIFGLVSFQYAAYHNMKVHDPRWIRSLVFLMFCLDTFHSASVIYMAWGYSVENYNNPIALLPTHCAYNLRNRVFSAIVLGISHLPPNGEQICLRNHLPPLLVFVGSRSDLWSRCMESGKSGQVADVKPLVTASLCLEVGIDSLITVTRSYVLLRSHGKGLLVLFLYLGCICTACSESRLVVSIPAHLWTRSSYATISEDLPEGEQGARLSKI